MQVFYIVVGSILALIGLLTMLTYFLPARAKVERNIIIFSHPDTIFSYLTNMKKWAKWSPWVAEDPNLEQVFSGKHEGEGATYEWYGNHQVGQGKIKITKSIPNDRVYWDLEFGPDHRHADSYFELRENENSTTVTWGFLTSLKKNPTSKIMGLILKGYIAEDYERGLLRLKTLMEQCEIDNKKEAPAAEAGN